MTTFLFLALSPSLTPPIVPPEPTEQTKPSTLPSVWVPDFLCRRFDMSLPVGDIVELVGPYRPARKLAVQPFRQACRIFHVIVRIFVGHGRHFDEFGAIDLQRVLLLLRLGVGDHDHRVEIQCIRHHRQTDAGIARSSFDDGSSRPQFPPGDRILDDVERRPVLDRLARIHELGFAQDGAAGQFRCPLQLEQGRVADGGGNISFNIHCAHLRPRKSWHQAGP